jgi:hypothetical protein
VEAREDAEVQPVPPSERASPVRKLKPRVPVGPARIARVQMALSARVPRAVTEELASAVLALA